MRAVKTAVKKIPGIGTALTKLWARYHRLTFSRSPDYWEQRYRKGGTSGPGSEGRLAAFKAEVLNDFVKRCAVTSVVEFGCGDGRQLQLARYPEYIGIDVSPTAIELCRARFREDATKRFYVAAEWAKTSARPVADAALSIDVIFHLVEDPIFEEYMRRLFASASRYVVIYSSDTDEVITQPHVRHRVFTTWVNEYCPEWKLLDRVRNPFPYDPADSTTSLSDFYIYERP